MWYSVKYFDLSILTQKMFYHALVICVIVWARRLKCAEIVHFTVYSTTCTHLSNLSLIVLLYSTSDSSNPHKAVFNNSQYWDCEPVHKALLQSQRAEFRRWFAQKICAINMIKLCCFCHWICDQKRSNSAARAMLPQTQKHSLSSSMYIGSYR